MSKNRHPDLLHSAPKLTAASIAFYLAVGLMGCGNERTKAPEYPEAALSTFKLSMKMKEADREKTETFTVYNRGKAPLNIDSAKLDNDAFILRVEPILPATLKASETATFTLIFRPMATERHKTTVEIASNDPKSPVLKVEVIADVSATKTCRSENPCQRATLDTKRDRCVLTHRRGSCDDGIACTEEDRCMDGSCIGIPTKKCYEGAGACIPGECDDAIIPQSLFDKEGQLRSDWVKLLKDS